MALVAPRGLMMASAYAEGVGDAVGIEQAYRSVRRVYQFLGKPENLSLYLHEGEHALSTEDMERYVDFFDAVFGRKPFPRPETWIHGYSFDDYRRLSGDAVKATDLPECVPGDALQGINSEAAWKQRKSDIRSRIRWVLGDEPATVSYPARHTLAHGRIPSTAGALAYLYWPSRDWARG
jgi:hypothetical protein